MERVSGTAQLISFVRNAREQEYDWNLVKKTVKSYSELHKVRDTEGRTVLHLSAETGHYLLTQYLASNKKVLLLDFSDISTLLMEGSLISTR